MENSRKFFLLLICLTFAGLISCQSAGDKPHKLCLNPPPVNSLKKTNNSNWNHLNEKKERYIHFGSRNIALLLSDHSVGRIVRKNETDFTKICASAVIQYHPGYANGSFYGHGKITAYFSAVLMQGTNGTINMTVNNADFNYKETATLHLYYIGTILISTWCLTDGDAGWLVWSTRRQLSMDEKMVVFDHIKSIGFDLKDVIPLYEDTCEKNFDDKQ